MVRFNYSRETTGSLTILTTLLSLDTLIEILLKKTELRKII